MSALDRVLALARGEAVASEDFDELTLTWSPAARAASAIARKKKAESNYRGGVNTIHSRGTQKLNAYTHIESQPIALHSENGKDYSAHRFAIPNTSPGYESQAQTYGDDHYVKERRSGRHVATIHPPGHGTGGESGIKAMQVAAGRKTFLVEHQSEDRNAASRFSEHGSLDDAMKAAAKADRGSTAEERLSASKRAEARPGAHQHTAELKAHPSFPDGTAYEVHVKNEKGEQAGYGHIMKESDGKFSASTVTARPEDWEPSHHGLGRQFGTVEKAKAAIVKHHDSGDNLKAQGRSGDYGAKRLRR